MKVNYSFPRYFALALAFAVLAVTANAGNAYGIRWASDKSPFVLQLGNNVNQQWFPALQSASVNWSKTERFDTLVVPGMTDPLQCAIVTGRIEVCNAKYGKTGWFGYASWVTENGYITGANVKLNDSYKQDRDYKIMIACHEVGHTLGLDHQDVTFGNQNLGTCLDYTYDPTGNLQPNATDYQTLSEVYSAPTLYSTVNVAPARTSYLFTPKSPRQWGKLVKASRNGGELVFAQEIGPNRTLFTKVTRVPGEDLADEDRFPQLSN